MKETILTVTSEKLKTVFFRGAITCAYLLEHKNSLNEGKNYRLYLYAGSIRVFECKYAFNPTYITAQLRAQDVPVFDVYQQDLTMQQAQDLFDLSK